MALRPMRPGTLLRGVAAWLASALMGLAALAPHSLRAASFDATAAAQTLATEAPTAAPTGRPRIGLVLSGGGARGLAHLGVLKVLEEMQVPIDVITGTSMGAIVGGLYATGMRAADLERRLIAVNWEQMFANRVERPMLSQRRKEEDFEISSLVELGVRDGELRTPQGAVSSRGLESLLRRYTLPVREASSFDQLPIPFRAVATDMETGQAVVMERGDLALALRSSMSVPGVFSPTDLDGRILGDGGLVNNTPVDVARALGADIVIVVNVGTPLANRETLSSAVGLTAQMVNILTEQNVQRSLASLTARDVLITPSLGSLSAGDFHEVRRFIALGEAGAWGRSDRLTGLGVDSRSYAEWRDQRRSPGRSTPTLTFVRIEGTTITNPERLLPMLETKPGQTFDATRTDRDTRRLASGSDYTRADYQLVREAGGDGVVFELEDKPWGPNYLHVGLDMSTDFRGRSAFNLKVSHNRHWLTQNGTEWRNRLQIGQVPTAFTELYRPLNWTPARADDWFLAAYAGLERRRLSRYDAGSGQERAVFRRNLFVAGADLGQPWGELGQLGELRLGWSHAVLRTSPELIGTDYTGIAQTVAWTEDAVRARAVVDQLDFATFPQNGHRAEGLLWVGRRSGDLSGPFTRIEAEGMLVRTWGQHTLNLFGQLQVADQRNSTGIERYTLGGFQQLSGYQPGQLTGNAVLLSRLTWYRRLSDVPATLRGFFVGGSLEAGNAWAQSSAMRLSDLRTGASLFVGADSGLGPLYLGITYAPKGSLGLALSIGKP